MPFHRSAKALLIDVDNSVLVLRRSSTHPTQAYEPDLPGGVIETEETHESGLVREIFEETGIVIKEKDLRQADLHVHPVRLSERTIYVVRFPTSKPEVQLSWEHDQYDWLPIDELNKLEGAVQKQVTRIIENDILNSI